MDKHSGIKGIQKFGEENVHKIGIFFQPCANLQALAARRYNEVEVQQLALETMKSDAWEALKQFFHINQRHREDVREDVE